MQSGHKELVNKSFTAKHALFPLCQLSTCWLSVCVCQWQVLYANSIHICIVPYECRKLRTFSVYIQVSYISLKPFRGGAVCERGNWFIYMIFNFVFSFPMSIYCVHFSFYSFDQNVKMFFMTSWWWHQKQMLNEIIYPVKITSHVNVYICIFFLYGTIDVFAGYQPFEPIKIGWILICLLLTCQAKYFLQYIYLRTNRSVKKP